MTYYIVTYNGITNPYIAYSGTDEDKAIQNYKNYKKAFSDTELFEQDCFYKINVFDKDLNIIEDLSDEFDDDEANEYFVDIVTNIENPKYKDVYKIEVHLVCEGFDIDDVALEYTAED